MFLRSLRFLLVAVSSSVVWPVFPALCQQSQDASGGRELVAKVIADTLPKDWICDHTSNGLVLRPKQNPIFVNTINARSRHDGESEEDYLREHIVHIQYCITVEFGPKIAASQVEEMRRQNAASRRKIKEIRESDEFRHSKDIPIPRIPREKLLVAEYKRLTGSLNKIPDGYFGDTSVYVQSSAYWPARFLSREIADECELVRSKVAGVLTRYGDRNTTDDADQ